MGKSAIREESKRPAAKEADLYSWALRQAELLRAGRLDAIDAGAIAEEIDDVGEEQYDKLESALRILMLHLLKWDHQPDKRSRSWTMTTRERRRRVLRQLRKMPRPRFTSRRSAQRSLPGCAGRGLGRDGPAAERFSPEAPVRLRGDHGALDRLARRRRSSMSSAN
jgi:Domain of unknown function DUF29